MSELRFYFDENVELGDEDPNHLRRATQMGRVLCTYDADYLRLAREGIEHSGIVFAQHEQATIGGWVRGLRALHARLSAEDASGQIIYLAMR